MADHPWYGTHRPLPAAPAEVIRRLLRTEIRDTGWPYQSLLPAVPMALPRKSYAELFRAGAVLLDLLRRTVLEMAPTTRRRMAALRVEDHEYPLFIADEAVEERYAHQLARPDAVIGPDGLRFLEFNVSGSFGGAVETHCRYEVWRRLHSDERGMARFAYHDPLTTRADLFADLCAELALPPRLAWVGSVRDQGVDSTRYFDLETDYLNARGFTARHFEPEDLHEAWDCASNLRFPLGLRHFTIPDWARLGIDTSPVRKALDNGCLLLSTQTSAFLANKQTLGLLSEGRPWLTSAERSFVDKYVPWTRVLAERRTHRAGRDVDLVAHVLAHREEMVLKAGIGMSGKEVVIGRETDQAAWESLVADAVAGGGSVAQEFVPPQTYRIPIIADGDDEAHEVDVAPVLSPFLFGGRPGGVLARFFGDGDAGVVSIHGHRSSDNAVVAV